MRKFYLLITLLLFSIAGIAQELAFDESFQSTQADLESQGWQFTAATVSSGKLTIEKKSSGGEAITPEVEDPSRIEIITNNTGNSGRVLKVSYLNSSSEWVEIGTYTVQAKGEESFAFDIEENVGLSKIQLQAQGGNPMILTNVKIYGARPISTEADILGFTLPGQIGEEVIDNGALTVNLSMPEGSDLNLAPDFFILSMGATVFPDKSAAQNFANPVSYIVTAEDGVTAKTWTVNVALVKSSEKEIKTFKLSDDQLGSASFDNANGIIKVKMPNTINVSNLVPSVLTISSGASISPSATTARDFSQDVSYTVTAQDESTKIWTVKTELIDPDAFVEIDFNKVVGWAAAHGGPAVATSKPASNVAMETTTGGKGGDIIYINPSTFGELCNILYKRINYKNYSSNPLIVVLEPGVYDGSGVTGDGAKQFSNNMLTIQEQGDISIIGKDNVQCKFGINVKRGYNIIIRNIYFWGYQDDAVNIGEKETHHIWIDHCTAGAPMQSQIPSNKDAVDGTFEVKNGASYVTVSWCVTQNHWKSCLIGHSDGNGSTDQGRLKVTHYANYYNNTYTRHPRVRFGQVHVLNCMYENSGWGRDNSYKTAASIGLGYGSAASNSSEVLMEGNFFYDVQFPFYADRSTADYKLVFGLSSSSTGNKPCNGLKQVDNDYDDSGLTLDLASKKGIVSAMLNPGGKSIKFDELNPDVVFNPSDYYSYDALTPAQVRELVPVYAGAGVLDWSVLNPDVSSISNEKKEENIKAYGLNSSICISGAADNSIVKVYNLSGVQVYKGLVSSGNYTLPVAFSQGFYIVAVGSSSFKVLVRN